MKKGYIVLEATPFEEHHKVVWGGSLNSCEKFCEKQEHYHNGLSTEPIMTWWKPQGGFFRIIEVGA